MSRNKGAIDTFHFTGAKTMSLTLGNTALSNPTTGPNNKTVRITDNAHGYLANSEIYIEGMASTPADLTYLNGLKKITAVDTNTFDVKLGNFETYVAGTPAGTETAGPIVTYDEYWELIGFDLTLDAASATSENFTATVDANFGSAFDANLYTKDMNTIADVVFRYSVPILLEPDDQVVFAWANTNAKTWGLRVHARRYGA